MVIFWMLQICLDSICYISFFNGNKVCEDIEVVVVGIFFQNINSIHQMQEARMRFKKKALTKEKGICWWYPFTAEFIQTYLFVSNHYGNYYFVTNAAGMNLWIMLNYFGSLIIPQGSSRRSERGYFWYHQDVTFTNHVWMALPFNLYIVWWQIV